MTSDPISRFTRSSYQTDRQIDRQTDKRHYYITSLRR